MTRVENVKTSSYGPEPLEFRFLYRTPMSLVSGNSPSSYDIKSAQLSVVVLLLKSNILSVLDAELEQRFGCQSLFFNQDPVLLDLSSLAAQAGTLDYAGLLALLQGYGMVAVAVKGGSPEQMQAHHQSPHQGCLQIPPVGQPQALRQLAQLLQMQTVVIPGMGAELPLNPQIVEKTVKPGSQLRSQWRRGGRLSHATAPESVAAG